MEHKSTLELAANHKRQESMFRYHYYMPVWNDKYIQLFLNYSLPSQLSPGNLPALCAENWVYYIFSQAPKIKAMIQSSALSQLRRKFARNLSARQRPQPCLSHFV